MNVQWTSDPSDPCGYCVDQRLLDEPPGPRVFNGIHPACQRMIDDYMRENEGADPF